MATLGAFLVQDGGNMLLSQSNLPWVGVIENLGTARYEKERKDRSSVERRPAGHRKCD